VFFKDLGRHLPFMGIKNHSIYEIKKVGRMYSMTLAVSAIAQMSQVFEDSPEHEVISSNMLILHKLLQACNNIFSRTFNFFQE
jgi:hypothetical protein